MTPDKLARPHLHPRLRPVYFWSLIAFATFMIVFVTATGIARHVHEQHHEQVELPGLSAPTQGTLTVDGITTLVDSARDITTINSSNYLRADGSWSSWSARNKTKPECATGYEARWTGTGVGHWECKARMVVLGAIETVTRSWLHDWSFAPSTRIESTLKAVNITGLADPAAGKVLFIYNGGPADVVFHVEDPRSVASNRIAMDGLETGDTMTVRPHTGLGFAYDEKQSRWLWWR